MPTKNSRFIYGFIYSHFYKSLCAIIPPIDKPTSIKPSSNTNGFASSLSVNWSHATCVCFSILHRDLASYPVSKQSIKGIKLVNMSNMLQFVYTPFKITTFLTANKLLNNRNNTIMFCFFIISLVYVIENLNCEFLIFLLIFNIIS